MSNLLKNSLFLSVSQVLGRLIGFCYYFFLARIFGVEFFGVYAWTIGLVYNFVPVADFGIERLVMRDLARSPDKANYYFQRLLPVKLALSGLAIFLIVIVGIILKRSPDQLLYLVIFGLGLIPSTLVTLISSIVASREKMRLMAITNVGLIGLYAIYGYLTYRLNLPVYCYFVAYFVANTSMLAVLISNMSRWGLQIKPVIDLSFIKTVLTQSWALAVINISAVFYLRLTLILVGVYLSAQALGYYGSVFKFVDAGILIPQAISLALFPLSSRLVTTDPKRLTSVYLHTWLVLFLLGLFIVLGVHLFGGTIIRLAYGVDYLPSLPVLKVLSFSLLLFCVNSLPGNIIQSSHKVKYFLPLALTGYLLTLYIGTVLIKHYGLMGAGYTVIIGELIGLVVNNWLVYRILKK